MMSKPQLDIVSERAAQCYLYRCTKRWFAEVLSNGAHLLSLDLVTMCKEKGLKP
jgi:hypothetical protein